VPCKYILTNILKEMGPFLGIHQFIIAATKWSAGIQLIEQLQYDMLRFMSPEAGRAILADYNGMVRKAIVSPYWSLTWYEEQKLYNHRKRQSQNQIQPNERKHRKRRTTRTKNRINRHNKRSTTHIPNKQTKNYRKQHQQKMRKRYYYYPHKYRKYKTA
jgi:hypothetical protein